MRPEQYRFLIGELAKTVRAERGRMSRRDAELETARRLNVSITAMRGVSVNACADRVLSYDLRSDTLAVEDHEGLHNDDTTGVWWPVHTNGGE